jgi:hypothetical protein
LFFLYLFYIKSKSGRGFSSVVFVKSTGGCGSANDEYFNFFLLTEADKYSFKIFNKSSEITERS